MERIDLPLDDIIKLNSSSRKRSRPSESGTAEPRFLGSSALVPRMPSPMTLSGGDSGEGTKLYVSNLDFDVSNEDIKLLFSDVGPLKRYGIHCDMSGRSMGTAEVVFFGPEDAIAAVRRYNNAQLDGKAMKIELIGTNLVARHYCSVEPYRAPAGRQRPVMTTQRHNCSTGWVPPQGVSGLRRSENVIPTAEALDLDLERHRLKAMKVSKLAEGS